jgi:hypothetical protein
MKKKTRAGTGCCSATERLEESIEERTKASMNWHHEQLLDLRRYPLDPDMFAVALAVRHVRQPLACGGSAFAHSDDESALQLKHLEPFLARAVQMTKKTQRFEHEWQRLQRVIPPMKIAWEKGQALCKDREGGFPQKWTCDWIGYYYDSTL